MTNTSSDDVLYLQGRCNSDPSQRSVTVMISDVCPECEADHMDIQALTYNKVHTLCSHSCCSHSSPVHSALNSCSHGIFVLGKGYCICFVSSLATYMGIYVCTASLCSLSQAKVAAMYNLLINTRPAYWCFADGAYVGRQDGHPVQASGMHTSHQPANQH